MKNVYLEILPDYYQLNVNQKFYHDDEYLAGRGHVVVVVVVVALDDVVWA